MESQQIGTGESLLIEAPLVRKCQTRHYNCVELNYEYTVRITLNRSEDWRGRPEKSKPVRRPALMGIQASIAFHKSIDRLSRLQKIKFLPSVNHRRRVDLANT